MNGFSRRDFEERGSMDLGGFQEGAKRDFKTLTERFNQNFNRLSEEELGIFRIKVADLLDLLRTKEKKSREQEY